MSSGPRPALVFSPYCPESIGEQIVQIPLLALLRRRFGSVVVVAPESSSHVLSALGAADGFVEYRLRAGAGELVALGRQLRSRRAACAYQIRKRSVRILLLARLATQGPVHGYRRGPSPLFQQRSIEFDTSVYLAELYLRLIGATLDEYSRELPRQDDGYALVIPVGLAPKKRYPMERWLDVARGLADALTIRFLLGPGMEADRGAAVAAGFGADVAPSLSEVERLVTRASVVVSNDCGPAHFAQIRDVPRVTLFERSIEWRHWFRPTDVARALRSPEAGTIASVPPEQVIAAVREVLGGPVAGR